ncbi:MAG: hypothetical protein K6F45_06710 [Saccharofermentans sp.]|nr:hypothetical protein [Saccharofermentans sp.]
MRITIPKAYKISDRLEIALHNKELNEDEIAEVYSELEFRKQKQKASELIVLIVACGCLGFLVVPLIVNSANIVVTLVTAVLTIAVFAGAIFGAKYCFVGKVANQWNKLLKEHYPDICDKYRL